MRDYEYPEPIKEHGTREEDLSQMAIALTAGGLLSILICAVLPGVESKLDILMMLTMLWFLNTVGVWELMDLREYLSARKANREGIIPDTKEQ